MTTRETPLAQSTEGKLKSPIKQQRKETEEQKVTKSPTREL